MKLLKKFSKGIIAVAICILLATTAWAATASYSATLDESALCVTELTEAKTVTLTAKVGETVAMDAFTAQVKAPENWEIKSIANSKLTQNFNSNVANGMLLWYAEDAENVNNDLLAEATVLVPAGTPAGTYPITFELIDISRDWGMPWEKDQTLTATLTVGEHADNDGDHNCDSCNVKVDCVDADNDGDHKCDIDNCNEIVTQCVAGSEWSKDETHHWHDCTECGADLDKADHEYDAAGKCVCGAEQPECEHSGEQTTSYTNNGDNHTVTVTYAGCGHTVETTADHEYDADGKCVCGAEQPECDHTGEQTPVYTDNKDGETHTVTMQCTCGATVGESKTEKHNFTNGDCACGVKKPVDPEEPVTGLKGDVNLDGVVTLTDAVLAAQYYMDWDTNPITDARVFYNADFNSDGTLSLSDAVEIAKYYMNN